MKACEQIRHAKDLDDAEILAAHRTHEGDTAAMARALEVSERALKLRLKTSALAED